MGLGPDGKGANRLKAVGTTAMGRIGDGASVRWGPTAMERNGWGLAVMGATAMGRDGWGLAAMGATAKGVLVSMGAMAMRPMRLKRPSPAGKADEADGDIETDGARLMRPMMLKRPLPAGKANEAEEAVTGVTIK